MRKILFFAFLLASSFQFASAQSGKPKKAASVLRHVVMFKFKDNILAGMYKHIIDYILQNPYAIKCEYVSYKDIQRYIVVGSSSKFDLNSEEPIGTAY